MHENLKNQYLQVKDTNNMKIVLIRNDRILRIYHHPRDVIVKPKAEQVEVFNSDGSLLEKFELIKKELGWTDDEENDTSEIVLSLTIGKTLQQQT